MKRPSLSNLDEAWHRHVDPELVFHYTTQEGLLGILSSGCLWATNLNYLNDMVELKYANKLAIDKLGEIRKRLSERILIEIEGLFKILNPPISPLPINQLTETINKLRILKANMFAASFGVDGDLLSLWRGYCKPGNGFSIGFKRDELERIAERNGWLIGPIVYSPMAQIECLNVLEVDAIYKCGKDADPKIFSDTYIEKFLKLGPFIKAKEFFEEGEWRIALRSDQGKINYRIGKNKKIPYITISLLNESHENLVKVITIGPNSSKRLNAKQIMEICKSKGIITAVLNSQIPLR